MTLEFIVISGVLLLLSIVLLIRLIYQNRALEASQEELQALGIEVATYRQKNSDQVELLSEKRDEIERLQRDNEHLKEQRSYDRAEISALQTRLHEQKISMQQRFEDLQLSRHTLSKEFEEIANKIFISSKTTLTQQNKEALNLILAPMQAQIKGFRDKVEEVYFDEAKERNELRNELKRLQELNSKMSDDAINLTNALKGESKTQGNWGEMVLEKVLESSGLRLGYEYEREVALRDEKGSLYRLDVLLHLPNTRDVIIDAKTSLKDYEEYMSTQNKEALKRHLLSIRTHIKTLSAKRYEELEGVNSLDFILMFIPISNALMVAQEYDRGLYEEAFKNRVVLVTPQTLLLSLRAIENSWRYEKQAKNAIEVTRLAQKLYGKIKAFVDDLEKVGTSLEKAKKSYEDAYSKLYSGKDNIIRQVEVFKTKANINPKEEMHQELVEKSVY